MNKPLIGFIGQGWIGKNYAADLERRGYEVVRYALEKRYQPNKRAIAGCDIVFIAVPTPTTPRGFDDRPVRSALSLVGKGKIAVIKSTMMIGRTRALQKKNPHCLVLHSPEFLSERTAAYDAAHPDRNIIGIPHRAPAYIAAAKKLLKVLPHAPFSLVCSLEEAELIKYAHNVHGYISIVFSNMLYDIAREHQMDWDTLSGSFLADPCISSHRYLNPVHKKGRGAGGNCFIKDLEAFIEFFHVAMRDPAGLKVLEAIRDKNIDLLVSTGKDIDIIEGVYGKAVIVRTIRAPKK
jgi:nucleotide sugar dehydrogenase